MQNEELPVIPELILFSHIQFSAMICQYGIM